MRRLLPALTLALLGAGSVLAQVTLFADPTTPAQWQGAAAALKAAAAPTDAILVHPHWSEAPLPYLHEVNAQVLWQDLVLPEDLHGARTLWFITETDRIQELGKRLRDQPSALLRPVHTQGAVSLVRVEGLATPFVKELWPHARSLGFSLETQGTQTPCTQWDEGDAKRVCPGASSLLAQHDQELLDGARHCLFIPLPPFGTTAQVEIPASFLAGSPALRLRVGQPLLPARIGHGSTLGWSLTRAADGHPLSQGELRADLSSWDPHDIVDAGEGPLLFRAWAKGPHQLKAICMNLWTKKTAP